MTATDFEREYLNAWREEAESGALSQDPPDIGECGSALFILADCYTSEPDRRESELDEEGLLREVKATLEKYQLL
ncbi:colicin immunity domain-containing protein [Pseudomonas batumici]|uniref:colicin immunity domain-containing protein n=1 Tax=Pseudomonas batumici TaxID=226910 RepID=UPI001ADFF1CC